jgi:hypothetical protein
MIDNLGNIPMCFGSWEASQMAIKSSIIDFSNYTVSVDLIYVGQIICNEPVLNITTHFLLKDRNEWVVEHVIQELWGECTTTSRFKKIVGGLVVETFAFIFDGILKDEKTWIKMVQQFSRTG